MTELREVIEGSKTIDVVCDIDGTMMNVEDRLALAIKNKKPEDRRMDWDTFLDPEVMRSLDKPNWDVVFVIKALANAKNNIIFTSARNERHRDVTEWQLRVGCRISLHENRYTDTPTGNFLYLRRDGDFRPDDITKKEILSKIIEKGHSPQLAFDDRDQVVSMWRSIGLPCFQVREGKF